MNAILDRDDFTIMKRAIYATQVIQSFLTWNIWSSRLLGVLFEEERRNDD